MDDRITPAYAGTTPSPTSSPITYRDHPRLRGDHVFPSSAPELRVGSPPLTRGPLELLGPCISGRGITPAYAGTTRLPDQDLQGVRDHPRLRGDHLLCCPPVSLGGGSPPLTRGPHRRGRRGREDHRITPAYAGTTYRLLVVRSTREDHPRLRGDHPTVP